MLEETTERSERKVQRFYFAAAAGVILVIIAQFVGWLFNDKTELMPDHSAALTTCFVLGALAALACIIFITLAYPKPSFFVRLAISVPFALIAFLAVSMVTNEVATGIDNRLDFPTAKTRTYEGYIWIWRAYQTHGKGRSWNIQTTPIWSNMNITEDDYQFMLTHRRPGDQIKDQDEIASKGYVCAKVTMQQAGRAVRVLHAGDRKLPSGTVVLCPADGKNIFQGKPSVLDY